MAKDYRSKTLKNGEIRYYKDVSLGTRADGTRRRTTITASSLSQLRQKEASLRVGYKVVKDNNSITFASAWDMYIKDCIDKNLSDGTLTSKKYKYNKYLYIFKNMKLSKIDDKKIEDFIKHLPIEQSSSTKSNTVSTLKTFMTWCYKKKMIETNPFDTIDNIKVEKPNLDFWTEDEFKMFIDTIESKKWKQVYMIAFYIGLRKGEIFGLAYEDFNGSRVDLSHTIKTIKGKQRLVDTFKNDGSKRSVPVPKWFEIGEGHGLLFKDGYRKCSYQFNDDIQLYNATHEHKIKKIRFHDLRHSYASYLIKKNIDIYKVSRFMGHTKIQTTIEKYAHLYDNIYEEISKLL